MTTLDAQHDGKISCGKCGLWVYERGGAIDYSPRHDTFLCVNCKDDEDNDLADEVNEYAQKHGFEQMLTGGGCTAFTNTFEMPDNSMFLITEEDGCDVPKAMDEACVVGRYTENMDVGLATRKGTFAQCIGIALEAKENWEPSPPHGDVIGDYARKQRSSDL